MAHFARVNSDNIVIDVVVVHNDEMLDNDGKESEAVGVAFLDTLFPDDTDTWVQTSYNHNMRGYYAKIGDTWDAGRNQLVNPLPWPSWVSTEVDGLLGWKSPVEKTEEQYGYHWHEDTTSWVQPPKPPDYPSFVWNSTTGEWNPPVAKPDDPDNQYAWDEDKQEWIKV